MAVAQEDALWRGYRSQLFRFVAQRVEDDDSAEDIVQDVLLRAYTRRGTLRDDEKFERWLYQITRNAVIDHYRGRRPTATLPADLAAPEDASSHSARRDLARCLRPFIGSLPEHYRDAIELSELEGLTQQETARRLGLSLPGAKSRVQRGRRLLEEKILGCCRVELDGRGAISDYEAIDGCREAEGPERGGCGGC